MSMTPTNGRGECGTRARELGFPMPLVRIAICLYRSVRRITLAGHAGRDFYPNRGITTGCSLAMTLIEVYTYQVLRAYTLARPCVPLALYVDDSPAGGGQ